MTDSFQNEKQIIRLAALVFGHSSDIDFKTDTILAMVEGIFVQNNNEFLSTTDIASEIQKLYSLLITEEEINKVIEDNPTIFRAFTERRGLVYCIENDIFSSLQEKQSKNIEYYVNQYLALNSCENPVAVRETINKFLYELTTTNLTSYRYILNGEKITGELLEKHISVDSSNYTEDERLIIHGFLNWESEEKNTAISNIILCCLEYCVVVSGDGANPLTQECLKKRTVYLDTNILFRALGINGPQRADVTNAFLNKGKQAGIELIVTSYTEREFMNAIQYHVDLAKRFPADNIYPEAFEEISDYNVYSFYYTWKREHNGLPEKLFWKYIESALANLYERYGIKKEAANVFNREAQDKINRYNDSIYAYKQQAAYYGYDIVEGVNTNNHDATLVYVAEQKALALRNEQDPWECYIVSSDKQLRFWDYQRKSSKVPLVIYPSQLFGMLLKVCGRSTDDIRSFISFINIKPALKQIPATQANAILSGITTLASDIRTQKLLVSAVIDDEFQSVLCNAKDEQELFETTKKIAQTHLEEELQRVSQEVAETKQKLADFQKENEEKAEQSLRAFQVQKDYQQSIETTLQNQNKQLAAKDSFIDIVVWNNIRWRFHFLWTILPAAAVVAIITLIILIAIGLFGPVDSTNLSTKIIAWFSSTALGKEIGDSCAGVLFGGACTTIGILFAFAFSKFSTHKRSVEKEKMKNAYIQKHQQDIAN